MALTPLRQEPSEQRKLFTRRYEEQANFVWRSLQHMGISGADLDDGLQEVFLVALRKCEEYDPQRARFTTWLFGICMRVASTLRRRRSSLSLDGEPVEVVDDDNPERACQRQQGLNVLEETLATLSPEHRATFVLFELEGEDCASIATLFDVPIGTVYSRLHTARTLVRAALVEHQILGSGEIP